MEAVVLASLMAIPGMAGAEAWYAVGPVSVDVNRTPCQGQFLKVGPLVLDSSTILVPLKWTFGNCLSEGP